jgi:inorganic pyrophosphatase
MSSTPFYSWRPRPWPGLEPAPAPPNMVKAYVEITPYDFVKCEVDKATGYLLADRPQGTPCQPPTLYGFVPPPRIAATRSPLSVTVPTTRTATLWTSAWSASGLTSCPVRAWRGISTIEGDQAHEKNVAVVGNHRQRS